VSWKDAEIMFNVKFAAKSFEADEVHTEEYYLFKSKAFLRIGEIYFNIEI
jgi:hypothetical protein